MLHQRANKVVRSVGEWLWDNALYIVLGIAMIYMCKGAFDSELAAAEQQQKQEETAAVQTLESIALGTPEYTAMPTPTLISTPTLTPTPTLAISWENNPFKSPLEYNVDESFDLIFERYPSENLKGTVVDSYLGYMAVEYDSGTLRPFSWMILRDQIGSIHYLIYPAEKIFPIGQEVNIQRYWEIKEGVTLMNNMLAYVTRDNRGSEDFYTLLDFTIESPAADGHVDGIIELGAVEYISPEEK
ncbi:hypothetical protein QT06_C0001G0167 [archaeon GW2011_AR15]|nr:hypothetical protein QT06_C0001G0167 [archaeon GW2011_AR15]